MIIQTKQIIMCKQQPFLVRLSWNIMSGNPTARAAFWGHFLKLVLHWRAVFDMIMLILSSLCLARWKPHLAVRLLIRMSLMSPKTEWRQRASTQMPHQERRVVPLSHRFARLFSAAHVTYYSCGMRNVFSEWLLSPWRDITFHTSYGFD